MRAGRSRRLSVEDTIQLQSIPSECLTLGLATRVVRSPVVQTLTLVRKQYRLGRSEIGGGYNPCNAPFFSIRCRLIVKEHGWRDGTLICSEIQPSDKAQFTF